MDPGHYGLQQGWDANSALEGYNAVHEPDIRVGGSYGGRRQLAESYPRDPVNARRAFHRVVFDSDVYSPPPHVPENWSHPRRRGFDKEFDKEYAHSGEPKKHDKSHLDSYRNISDYRQPEKHHQSNSFHEVDTFGENYHNYQSYHDANRYRDFGFDRHSRLMDYEIAHHNHENIRERDYDFGRYTYDSDHDSDRRDSGWRRHESCDRGRDMRPMSREEDPSSFRRYDRSRSPTRSHGHDYRSRSRSHGRRPDRGHREDSYDDSGYEKGVNCRDHDRYRDDKCYSELSVAPSATVVVRGLLQKTTDEDLYQVLAKWAPLHVRVIKERNSGISRGFAFIDFPTLEAARSMMDGVGEAGLIVDGRKLFFEYSSKPTGGRGAPSVGQESTFRSSFGRNWNAAAPSDWICTICGCVNFARRTSCFQCNERRTVDAPPADLATSNSTTLGKRGSEAGPTHILVVRGLEENSDEEMLRYEFAKYAPVKDIRLIRDKFTHISRGFAFVHFHTVEDATKALEATNGTTLERNGQMIRVSYAKSIYGPGSSGPQSSSLAAAAIEAATFAQQYDVGWAPKEYNADDKQSTGGIEQSGNGEAQKAGSAPQSGFVWDEKSGYYYDTASGFYYDGNTGLYYDGNNATWYTYDHQNQQYVPCTDQSSNKVPGESTNESSKASDGGGSKEVVISAPATTTRSNVQPSLPDVVQAAAAAALAAEKKEKEKLKEMKLASKSSLLANKKKMNNVVAMWKQRNQGGQAAQVVLDDNHASNPAEDKQINSLSTSVALTAKNKLKSSIFTAKDTASTSAFVSSAVSHSDITLSSSSLTSTASVDRQTASKPMSNSSGGTIKGMIRGSGRGVIKSDTKFSAFSSAGSIVELPVVEPVVTPFRTDASALGSYASPVASGSGKRRFSEAPMQSVAHREQPQQTYRGRAAERRHLYGSTSFGMEDHSDIGLGEPNGEYPYRKGSSSDVGAMPFPPGVGGACGTGYASSVQNYEVITADRAINGSNVGNRMLRNMGWQEGLPLIDGRNTHTHGIVQGLGKDGSGIKEPIRSNSVDDKSGLGIRKRKVDSSLEAQAGDSYRTIIQKKAIARFREMA